MEGKWYAVDVTWDDPIIIGSGKVGDDIRYKYFLKGSNAFYESHREKFDVESEIWELSYPTLETQNY